MTLYRDVNAPEAFYSLLPIEQSALRLWIQLALEPTAKVRTTPAYGSSFRYSYGLKHYAEDALGWYVSNGELKGAMLAEGYHWLPAGDKPLGVNWYFNSRRRCPHRTVRGEYTARFTCPLATVRRSKYDGTIPALCQASPEELARFDVLRTLALADRRAGRTREGDAQ